MRPSPPGFPRTVAGAPMSGLAVASLKCLWGSRSHARGLILLVEGKGACLSNPPVQSATFDPSFPRRGDGAAGTTVAEPGLKEQVSSLGWLSDLS